MLILASILSELFADDGRWQKGGAGHSANEQDGRKEGKVSILTLAAFKFRFHIPYISLFF